MLDGQMLLAFCLFVAAGISDGIDGFVAKRFDMRTELGRYLDPIADKALLVSVYITLGSQGYLPNWLVIPVAFRDILIIGGILLDRALSRPTQIEPLMISKFNTVAQIALASLVLISLSTGWDSSGITDVLIYITAATTIVSGIGYLIRWGRGALGADSWD